MVKEDIMPDDKLLDEMEANGQVIWKYCDAEGNITPEANPNGSTRSIAGICNKERNVIGLMPHPERAVSENLGNTDGRKLFQQIFNSRNFQSVTGRQSALVITLVSSRLCTKDPDYLFLLFIFLFFQGNSQDSTAVKWHAHTDKSK